MNTIKKITSLATAPRRDIENYIYDSWGYNDLEDYTTEDLRNLIRENNEVDLFMGYVS